MINKPHTLHQFFTHHPLSRSLNASTIQSSLKQPHTNQNNEHISRNPFDWDKFVPTASRLIESFGVFYNRSTDYRAALKYEELKSQGYRPVKRSKVNHRWWEEERKRGRVQPDHEQRYFTQDFQATHSRIHHKHSPDVVDIVGDHTAFAFPDLDYTLLDSESDPASVVHRQLGVSPGAKGIRGLRPGSFLELRRTNQSEAGILVRTHGNGVVYVNHVATRAYDENYLIDGLNDPVIPAAGFEISPEELVSKGETIASARRACCRALRVGQMTSEEGVKFLLDQRSADNEIMVFALHQQLMGNADMFTANAREMRDKSTFLVQSSHTLTALYTVRNWIATNSSELDIFVEKCKTVVQAHRQQKASVNPETPLEYAPSSFPSWTSTDRMFIEVFRAIAINQRLIQDQPYSVIAACDGQNLAFINFRSLWGYRSLTDLGILPAWQSVGLWNPDLDLTERITEQFESLAISSGQKIRRSKQPSSSSSALPHSKPHRTPASQRSTLLSADDPADLLRHDFGDLPVFIIDDPGAQELDDGISIEPITQSSGELEAWIHVHVADPTAHLGPSDPISLRARSYLDTVTFLDSPYQCFRRNSSKKTLSFSARINQNGEILEYKIRPGLIKNTKQLTYQTVTEVLDGHQTSNQRTVHIGPDSDRLVQVEANSERTLSAHELSQVERDHIQELGRFSRILIKNRVDGGAIGWQLPMAKVSIRSDPMVSPRLGIPLAPASAAQILVSEMMIMAGRLAGRFYVDESPGSQDFRLAFRSNRLRFGLISPFKFLKSRMMFMPAVNGLSPMDHFPLGINDRFGYCKVTSPLRRYSDLVAHWQIKNALLRRAGRPTYSDKQEVLSLKGMKGMIDRLDRESKSIVNLDRKMNISWVSYLLRRMISDRAGSTDSLKIRTQDGGGGGDEGAEGFKALVHEELTAIILRDPVLMRFTNRWTIKAYIPELGLRASLITDNPSLEDLGHDPVGLRVPVYIAHINQEDHVILKIDHNRPNFLIESTV
ncbi:hypothetical protein KEM48_011757 [Puccinia striiformis f. sp. tritici PST-130]|nr:hypothetical protein KEM48_011757 [Puccinia striiformis f. sp. tritici PST-130]